MKTQKNKYNPDSGFKVPENYFGSLEEKLMQRLNEEKSGNIPVKGSGFTVPEDYFENLENRILSRVTEDKPKVIKLFKKEYIFYAAAVAAIFVLMLGNFFQTSQQQTLGWDDIEISAMENYFDDSYNMGYIEWSTSEYSDFIVEDANIIHEDNFREVDNEAVFDYLDENIEDPTYILE